MSETSDWLLEFEGGAGTSFCIHL